MLQDLAYGKLDIVYEDRRPQPEDLVICIRQDQVLVKRDPDDRLHLPTCRQVEAWAKDWQAWGETQLRYAFCLQERRVFLWMGEAGEPQDPAFAFERIRGLRQLESKEICFGIMTGWHLFAWYRNNRYCGCCREQTVHNDKERFLRCSSCGNMIFPRINPAVIIAVTQGDRLLLSKYAGREYTRYALLAGFMEIGETAEETVAREVMEEVGLKVKNIRYYKSQPWGVDGNVLLGFFCDLDGDDTICLDTNELSMAQWFPRDAIPAKDDGISLTREMIRVFSEGREK